MLKILNLRTGLPVALAMATLTSPVQAAMTKVGNDLEAYFPASSCGNNVCSLNVAFNNSSTGQRQTVNVTATAWAILGGSGFDSGTHVRADIHSYDYGFGVGQNDPYGRDDESGYSPYHAMDNSSASYDGYSNPREYIALNFGDTKVSAESVKLALYSDGDGFADADTTIIVGNVPTGFNSYVNPLSQLSGVGSNYYVQNDYSGGINTNAGNGQFAGLQIQDDFTFGEDNHYGNVVLVAADLFKHGSQVDFFKLKNLVFDVWEGPPPEQVPAPAALGLLGLGAGSLALRRRQRSRAAA